MNFSDIKPYLKKTDPLRWFFGSWLLALVFKETGFATLVFAILVLLESEFRTFLDRIKNERDAEIAKFLKGMPNQPRRRQKDA